ncbi:MAG: SAM-dependent methyltransferase [Myxococcota bacterium]
MPRKKRNTYKRGDQFTQRAKDEGFKARSVYKLAECDRRFRVLKQGQRVIDLGCYPGSWSQYVLQRIGRPGTLVGVDFKAPELPRGRWIARSVMEVTPEELLEQLDGRADVVLSDMAQPTTGIALTDHVRQLVLVRKALELAVATLAPGGSLLVKVFDGEEVPQLQADIRAHFGRTRRIRPEAVRQVSREFYILAMGFKGANTPT